MKRAVPNSPTLNPRPAKTNLARVTTTRSIPPTPQDHQVPTTDANFDSIGDPVGGGVEPSSDIGAAPESASNVTLTASKTPATSSGVQKDSKAKSMIVDDDEDADWVDEDDIVEDDETDSSSSGSDDEEYLFEILTKHASKEKWSAVPTMKTTKATALELDAVKDMEALLDSVFDKIEKRLKLSIARYRAKTAACVAETREIESRIEDLAKEMEYTAGLTPLEVDIYHKTRLEEAMLRRLEAEYEATRLKQETIELRRKMLLLNKSSNNFSEELPQFVDSSRDPRLEQVLGDTARLLGDDFA